MRLAAACLMLLAVTATASGESIVLFHETFDDYHFSHCSRTNQGIPLESEGADETWYGGRFEYYDGYPPVYSIYYDVAMCSVGGKKYARFEDEAGILFNVSTVDLLDATLSFDWKTHLGYPANACFVAGYYIEEDIPDPPGPTIPNDLGFDLGANRLRDFFADDFGGNQSAAVAWWSGEWTEILRNCGNAPWQNFSTSLPVGKASIWVAFWIDGGEGDYGKVDNVLVCGEPVPEPSTLALLAFGFLGLAFVGRRRKR